MKSLEWIIVNTLSQVLRYMLKDLRMPVAYVRIVFESVLAEISSEPIPAQPEGR